MISSNQTHNYLSNFLGIKAITLSYLNQGKRHRIIHDFSLQVPKQAIHVLQGASGCGKSTLLRAIAGFETLDAGEIYLNQQLIASSSYHKPAYLRQIGMMFQDYGIFPHLSVTQNIAFGLRGLDKNQQKERINELLVLTQLEKQKDFMPHQLSGGQLQRVALARSLAPYPLCLLLDEPFSNLDNQLRQQLQSLVRDILKQEKITAILVTHDEREAEFMGDHITYLG